MATACSAWFALTSPKTSRAPNRSPEQTRPRLFLRSRAPREADNSPDEADAAPQAQSSSIRHHDVLHRDHSDVPSYGWSGHNTRTLGPVPLPNGPTGPARPSVAGTPAHTADESLPLRTPPLHSLKVSTEPGQLHPIPSHAAGTGRPLPLRTAPRRPRARQRERPRGTAHPLCP